MKIVAHLPATELLKGLSALREIISLGTGVEFQLTADVLDSFTFKDYGRLKEEVKGVPVTVHAPFLDLNPGALDPYVLEATRRRFLETVSVAKVLGAGVIVFHTGYHPRKVGPFYREWFRRAVETFQIVSEEFEGKIALENVFDETPAVLEEFMGELPPSVGACIDVGHLNLFSKVPLNEWFRALGDRIYEFHIHDNRGVSDEHAPAGSGTFDFESLFMLLDSLNSDYIFNLENKSPSDVRRSLDFFRRSEWKGKSEFTRMRS